MAAIGIDEDEVLMARFNDIEWVDNTAKYQCTRCNKVLVQHYISNCKHKFCRNCKRILDDGSHRWRCPECQQFIEDMGRQEFEFRDRVFKLRVYCPNRKYGCQHICPFKDLKEHLERCEDTKERALPVLYEGDITSEMVEQMLSNQLSQLRNEMREQMTEVRKVCDERDNEITGKLKLEVNQLKQRMTETEKKQKDRKLKLKADLFMINNRVDGVKSDLTVETTRLNNEINEIQKSVSLAVEENKSRILELKGKTEAYNEMMDSNYRKTNELITQLKKEVKKELKTKDIKMEQTMSEMKTAQEKEWAETKDRVEQCCVDINHVNAKADIYKAEMENGKTETDKKMEILKRLDQTSNKTEVEQKLKSIKAEVEAFKIITRKETIAEINKKVNLINKKLNEKNHNLTQQVESIKDETQELANKIEGNKAYTDDRVNKQMSAWKNKMESLEQTKKTTSIAQERKRAETNDKLIRTLKEEEDKKRTELRSIIHENASQILSLDTRIGNLDKNLREDLVNQSKYKNNLDKCLLEISKVKEIASTTQAKVKANKEEVEMKLRNVTTEAEKFKINNRKEILEEINKKVDSFNRETDEKINKNKQEVIEESRRYADGKANEMISSLSKKLDEKITTIEKTTRDNQLISNKKMEQKVFHLQSFVLLRNPQMNVFTLAEDKCNFQPDFTWKISGLKEMLKQTTFEIKSDEFMWTRYPVQAQAKMEVEQDGLVYVSLCLKEINEGKAFHLKRIPSVFYVLRDRSGNRKTKHRSRSITYLFKSLFNLSFNFERQLAHQSWLTKPLYNVDDSIVVEVYVEPPSMAQLVHSYDGSLVWAIDNYRKRKEMAKEELVWCQESPYFYTAPNGYRVQVDMWLNGRGEYREKGLTASILFVTGKFDDDLPLTFTHRTTVTLFNRKDPQRNITKTVDQDIQTKKEYFIDMCSDKEIENVIKNDTVFFKVTIKPKH